MPFHAQAYTTKREDLGEGSPWPRAYIFLVEQQAHVVGGPDVWRATALYHMSKHGAQHTTSRDAQAGPYQALDALVAHLNELYAGFVHPIEAPELRDQAGNVVDR